MKALLKWIQPRPIVLANGKVVQPKLSPAFYVIPILVVLTHYSIQLTRFRLDMLIRRGAQFFVILNGMIPPNFAYFERIWEPLLATLMMSIIGTLAGSVLALPAAYISSENMIQSPIVKLLFRAFSSVLRTFPILVLALLFRIVFGIGAFAGTMAIGVFTFTIMTKMFYELIDTADMGPFEALLSSGATRFKAFWSAIMPQLWGQYISLVLYNFEMNIRNAAVLGYVGAGGIGLILNERLGWRIYADVGMILLAMMVTVYVIETLSRTIRQRLL
jgi:phosphonate transport system permease protein